MKFKTGDIVKFIGPEDTVDGFTGFKRNTLYKIIKSEIVPANQNISKKDYERVETIQINNFDDFTRDFGVENSWNAVHFELVAKKSLLPDYL